MTGQTLNGTTVNGHQPARVPVLGDWQPIHLGGLSAVNDHPQPQPATTPAETAPTPQPAYDPIALAEADRIRALAEAEAEARRIEAEGNAEAAKMLAAAEAEKQRLANEKTAMRQEKDRIAHETYVAEKEAKTAEANAAKERAEKAAAAEEEKDAARVAEQQRTHELWKWAARGIYAAGLIIAAPIQFLAFWSRSKPFLVAAPVLLEGFALALAFGAAWAVAHRRDVLPYRIGIMLGAAIAAGINLWHGLNETKIGLNAGIIGAIASLGGPIVLMAYERGMAQKADGIPSRRETRAAKKQAAAEKAARDKAKADREAAAKKAADEKAASKKAAEAEQQRKDTDRQSQHLDVWEVAEALRSARGVPVVTDQIWADAWYRVTGSKAVGVRPEMEAQSRAAHERMKAALDGSLSQVESQMPQRSKRAPDAPDGRRFNGGTPPRRTPGDTAPYSDAARLAASETARQHVAREDS